MRKGAEAGQGIPRMQWAGGAFNIPQVKRHDTPGILAVVSAALGQAYAKPRREYVVVEEWLNDQLQVCCAARQRDGRIEVKLVVRNLRLDNRRSARRPRVQS